MFHPQPGRFVDRGAYEEVWNTWLADGWRVVSGDSTERVVQIYGSTAILTHRVQIVTAFGADESVTDGRQRIVLVAHRGELRAVHEPADHPTAARAAASSRSW